MGWRRMGRLCVTVHTEHPPTNEEWAAYVEQAGEYRPLQDQRVLVVSAGGAPDGKQRKLMVDVLQGARVPVAILTNSLVMRAAGVAVSWFNPMLKVFGPDALDSATQYLDLTAWERRESESALKELQRGLSEDVDGLSSNAGG